MKYKRQLLFLCLFLGIFVLAISVAQAVTYKPNITIPFSNIKTGQSIEITSDSIGEYIRAIYKYAGVFAGALAMFMLVYAGWQWLMAAGNASKIQMAKETINDTLVGLAFLFGGYLLLSQISLNLVTFKPLVIKTPNIVSAAACRTDSDCDSGYKCTHKIYLSPVVGQDPYCPDYKVEYLVGACSDTGDSYDRVSYIEAQCSCREARLIGEDTKCEYTEDTLKNKDFCQSQWFRSKNTASPDCVNYRNPDDCRANICYNQIYSGDKIFRKICGMSMSSVERWDEEKVGDNTNPECQNIEDVACKTNADCMTGDGIGNYCCELETGVEDFLTNSYCRPRDKSGVVCMPN